MNSRDAQRVLRHVTPMLMKNPDVVGVTSGLRLVRHEETPEECITVFVRRKKAPSRIRANRRIPRYFCGRRPDGRVDQRVRIYTDVVQMTRAKPASSGSMSGSGIRVQAKQGTLTLAFRCSAGGTGLLLLSNRHVLAPRLQASGSRTISHRWQGRNVDIGNLAHYFAV